MRAPPRRQSRRRRSRPSTRPPGPRRAHGPMRHRPRLRRPGRPERRSPAITPVSTSPDPAVASAALPVSFRATRPGRPSACGLRDDRAGTLQEDDGAAAIGEPLRRRHAIVPDRLPREQRILAVVGSEHRGHAEGLARAQRLEIAVERVEAVGVEHEREACLGDECDHRLHAPSGPGRGPGRARAHGNVRYRRVPRQLRAAASAPSGVAGSARVMTSEPAARSAASSPGRPHQTIPAPARIAAWLTNIGAPVMPPDPPTTITPAIHL